MELSPLLFGIYKLVKYAIYPYTWFVALLGLLMLLVFRPVSPLRLLWIRLLTLSTLLLVYVLGSPIVARMLVASLEEQYLPFDGSTGKRFDAIVVLAGGVLPKGTLRPIHELTNLSRERTACGADLYRRGYAAKVFLSGGDASIFEDGPEEANEMKHLAVRLGVPDEAIVIENRSRTSYENAVETKKLLGNQSILLVTSATHIPRAVALFRRQGLNVTPAPCGYLARHRVDVWEVTLFDFLPQVSALQLSTNAISEMVGMWVYRLAGKL
ncbi:MAG: hypothetical protein C4293_13880 [Nitrospiraceae bacterium]